MTGSRQRKEEDMQSRIAVNGNTDGMKAAIQGWAGVLALLLSLATALLQLGSPIMESLRLDDRRTYETLHEA